MKRVQLVEIAGVRAVVLGTDPVEHVLAGAPVSRSRLTGDLNFRDFLIN
jgi:hypothetical protein